ncbi:MAG: FkbM family methyltransferase [Pararhodobacter sp.]
MLTALSVEDIAADPDRGALAALAAVAHSHVGELAQARHLARLALEWGCGRAAVARVLVASVHDSLARCALGLGDTAAAEAHFTTAVGLLEPRSDNAGIVSSRQFREQMRLGLLPDAQATLQARLTGLKREPAASRAQLDILHAELDLLKHELSIALQRNQLFGGPSHADADTATAARGQAVSQLGQDLWVLERTNHKREGYFVEFGATDGLLLSNTWLLEKKYGWTGLCAEPNPAFHEALRKNRSCIISDACIGPRTGENVEFILADVFGGIADFADADQHKPIRAAYRADGRVLQLQTISLEDFLLQHKAPRVIDYLSIDTEGSEYDILSRFPFERWEIRLVTVEHNYTPQRAAICKLLTAHGYRRTEAQWDDWYELHR